MSHNSAANGTINLFISPSLRLMTPAAARTAVPVGRARRRPGCGAKSAGSPKAGISRLGWKGITRPSQVPPVPPFPSHRETVPWCPYQGPDNFCADNLRMVNQGYWRTPSTLTFSWAGAGGTGGLQFIFDISYFDGADRYLKYHLRRHFRRKEAVSTGEFP